jgi:NitT/TauT family transport system substrate-binding protein
MMRRGLSFGRFSRLGCVKVALLLGAALLPGPSDAAERVRIAAFQGTFINFPIYVAKDLGLFEKHGLAVEIIYGKGIQPTNMVVSGATEFGGFAVEHGITVIGKGQHVKLLVLNQTLPPFNLIVRNDVPTPSKDMPYPAMIKDIKGLKLGISTPGASTDLTLRFLLQQAGLDPQRDVKLIPVGEPSTQIAALKNGLIDGTLAFEPIQAEAVLGQKIAKSVLDIEAANGPEMFHEYAYNGIFAKQSYLDSNPQAARAIVAAIVEAEQMINDPKSFDRIVGVAEKNMVGVNPEALRLFLTRYKGIFNPIATPKAIENVNAFLLIQKHIEKAVPFSSVIATSFMPTTFPPASP